MNVPPPTYDSSLMTTTLTPYLTLPHLLSLTWLAYPILSLAFIAFRLTSSLSSAQSSLGNAKSTLLASCKAAETAATSAASMPRFLAIKTNEQYVDAVNGSLDAARKALVLSLTIMEAIINFIIDLYRSTLLCFLELVVRGGLSILISAVNEINQVLQSLSTTLKSSIQNDIQSANSVIQSAIDGINKINPFSDITAPQIPVPNLDALNNIQLPPTIQNALTNLNSSLPTVAELKNEVEGLIDTPFELVKKEINDTFAGIVLAPEGMPLPERSTVTFCNDMDLSVVDDLGRDLIKAAKIGLVILFVIVLVLIGLNCLLEWYRWRCLKQHMEYTRQAWNTDPILIKYPSQSTSQGTPTMTMSDHNLLILANTSAHPLLTRILNQLSNRLHLSQATHVTLSWFTSYIFHPAPLACLLVALLGLLSIELQLLALRPLEQTYQTKGAQQVNDFSTTIASAINTSMFAQSASYASGLNTRLVDINTQLSTGVLGSIQNTTIHINTTIANFYADVQEGVEKVFGGTILDAPVQEFVKCFLGSKVDAVENVLTFLEREVAIQLPLVNESVLVLQPDQVQELARPIALAAVGGDGSDPNGQTKTNAADTSEGGGLLQKIVREYIQSLEKERLTFLIFLGCWGVVVLMGVGIILWNRRKARRGRRGSRISGYNYDTGTGVGIGGRVAGVGGAEEDGKQGWFTTLKGRFGRMGSGRKEEKDGRKTLIEPFRMSVGEDGERVWNWGGSKGGEKGLTVRNEPGGGKTGGELKEFTPMPSPVPPPGLSGFLKRNVSDGSDFSSKEVGREITQERQESDGGAKGPGMTMRKTIGAGWARRFADRFVGGSGHKTTASEEGLIPSSHSTTSSFDSGDSGVGFPAPAPAPPLPPKKAKRTTLMKPQPFSSQPREEFLEDPVPPTPTTPTTPRPEEGRHGAGLGFFRPPPTHPSRGGDMMPPMVPRKLNAPNPIAHMQPSLPPSPSPATMRIPPPMLRVTVNPPSGDFSGVMSTQQQGQGQGGRPNIGLPMPMRPRVRNLSISQDSSQRQDNPFSPPAPISPPPAAVAKHMRKDSTPMGVSPFSPERTGFSSPPATFAPPLHHGFNDSRYPTLVGGRGENGATTISAAAFRSAQQQQQHQRRQSTLMVPPTTPGGGGGDHRRSFSVPMPGSAGGSTAPTPTTAGSTMTTSELQRSMLRGLSGRPSFETLTKGQEVPPVPTSPATSTSARPGLSLNHAAYATGEGKVNPFDDERRVRIEMPARTRKSAVPSRTSMKANPFEVVPEGESW